MKVCYFGTYEKDYPRNRVIIEGLRENGVEVIECHYPLWEREENKTGDYLSFINLMVLCFRLLVGYLYLSYRYFSIGRFDVLMVGYIGQIDLFLAKLLNSIHRRPIVFNPLISIYDALVLDREIFQKKSLIAKFLFYLDKWSMQLSDLVIFDTNAHIEYLADLFHIDRNKFLRVFIGADEKIFVPGDSVHENKDETFCVLFYGKFIPLHGIHHILNAAKKLEGYFDIRFQIIGKGQLSDEIHRRARALELKNVEFLDWVNYSDLPHYIGQADVCLGIFGDTSKAKRVIPNKVFQYLAMGKPVITCGSPAFSELLKEGEDVLFCDPPFDRSIKGSILQLKENIELRRKLSVNAEALVQERLVPDKITSGLVEVLKHMKESR